MEKMIRNLEIDAHGTDPAIVFRYEQEANGEVSRKHKIIQLKNLSGELNCSALTKQICDQCSFIPSDRFADVEQIVFYLQKRLGSTNSLFGQNDEVGIVRADLGNVENYIELLYEDQEKLKASSLILSLCSKVSNLSPLAENEVLMGALSRVFREDSQKNFELATNLASIFCQISRFSTFHPALSKFKIGAISLQLVENEMKRRDQWNIQAKQASAADKRKWELALKKQDAFIAECLKLLMNLAVEVKVEGKMVKRGLLPILAKCLEFGAHDQRHKVLAKAAAVFLWKLSSFQENKNVMAQLNVIENVGQFISGLGHDTESLNIAFALLFNLSFDSQLRLRMVQAGLVNPVSMYVNESEVALGLLYQLSIVDDAKAMFTFTDSISHLVNMVDNRPDALCAKATLVNIAVEKRNAQIIVGADGEGLKKISLKAFKRTDPILMKIIRNVSQHDGIIQEHLTKYIPELMKAAKSSPSNSQVSFSADALATLSNLQSTIDWPKVIDLDETIEWISKTLKTATGVKVYFPEEFLLQLVAFMGALATNAEAARKMVSLCEALLELLNRKQEDDEFCLQISFIFLRMLAHPETRDMICSREERVVDYLINMSHDKNGQLRELCDQALQLISETNEHWFKRINEERFCWHNAQWLDMVTTRSAMDESDIGDDDENLLEEQFRAAVLGADEIFEDEY